MVKRLQSVHQKIKNFFAPLQLPPQDNNRFYFGSTLEPYSTERIKNLRNNPHPYSDDYIQPDDETDKINKNRLEQAKLSQTYEGMAQSNAALNLTLKSQHRLLIATLVTALVALIVGLISLFNKPPVVNIAPPVVNVQPPTVNIQPPDVNVNVTPQ